MTGNSSSYRFALVFTTAVVASLLLVMSWPRLNASLRYLPVDTAISNYWKSHEFDHTQLDGLIARAGESIAIHDHYRYREGLSELQILRSHDMSLSFWERRQALELSILAAIEVVKQAPAKPRTWLRIARAKEFLAYPAEEVIPPLKMSILTGRVEPRLMLTRLELGLRYLPVLDDEDLRLIRDQAMLTWASQKRPMIKRIESGALSLDLLREVLSEHDQDIILEMEAHFVQ